MGRNIKYIAVHCTASRQTATVGDIKMEFKRKGWKYPGYHYLISPDGKITQLLDESLVSNGVIGYNSVSVNVAYIGGITDKIEPVDNRTDAQRSALRSLLHLLHKRYPKAVIQGHRDFPNVAKACPCFDARTEYKDI